MSGPSELAGAGPLGHVAKIFDGSTCIAEGTVTGSGYSVTTGSLGEGTHVITVRFIDPAGNLSDPSPALTVTIDTTKAAAATVAPDLTAAKDSGTSNSDNLTNQTVLVFTGAGPLGHVARIFNGSTCIGADTVTGSGYSVTTGSLGEGTHVITVRFIDPAGNLSDPSPALTVTIDTTKAAAATVAPDLTAAKDTGTSNSDNITNQTVLIFTGAGPLGHVARIFDGSTWIGAGTVTGSGYSVTTISLGVGTHVITVRFIDPAGNLSDPSPALTVTIIA